MLSENQKPIRMYFTGEKPKEEEELQAKDILYPNSKKEKEQKAYRNQLLYEIGDDLPQSKVLYADINELEKIKEQKFNENSTVKTPPFMPNPMVKLKFEEKSTKKNGIVPSNTKNKGPTGFATPINKNQNNTGNNSLNNENFKGSNQQEIKPQTISGYLSYLDNANNTQEVIKKGKNLLDDAKENIKNTIKEKTQGLVDTAKNIGGKFLEYEAKGGLSKWQYGNIGRFTAEKLSGPDTIGMLDISENHKKAKNYTKDAIKLENYKDNRLSVEDIKYLEKKTKTQFERDGFDINKIPGYHFNSNSKPSIRIANDPDFRDNLIKKKEEIQKTRETTGAFPSHGIIPKKSDLHYAIGSYDLRNAYVDEEGNFHGQVYDTYDFNEQNKNPINQAGRKKMLDGTLQPFFTIHDIYIPKEELDKFW